MSSSTHVVVIGAGLAGLTAAQELALSCKVTVLEARGRLGGRVFSQDHWEAGANWLHGETGLSDFVETAIYDPGDTVIHDMGYSLSPEESRATWNSSREIEKAADVADCASETAKSHAYFCKEAAAQLKSGERALRVGLEEVAQDYGADAGLVAYSRYRAIVDNVKIKEKDPVGDDRLVVGGFDRLITHLSEGLNILKDSPVSCVTYSSTGCKITYCNDQEVECDHVICTVPLGVLKSGAIQFNPSLPSSHQMAIDELKMGLLVKVVLTFKNNYWGDTTSVLFINKKRNVTVFLNLKGSNTLIGMFAGERAEKITKKSDEEIKAKVLKILHRAYPDCTAENLVHFDRTHWGEDPYAMGAYSYVPIESSIAQMHALKKPVGNLFFAGEHTHTEQVATMQAAVISGKDAARRLLESKVVRA